MKGGEDSVVLLLRSKKLRATRQRVALLHLLRDANMPQSVEAIQTALKRELDLATAYRALQEFERAGLVRRVQFNGGSALYEAVGAHHHHLMCKNCGRIEDVDVCLPPSVRKKLLASSKRFKKIDDRALDFYGLCTSCV